jgi:hypothetical protein
MPYGYTPPAWRTSGPVSGPHGGGRIPTGGGGNRPPSERVWEEDRRDETPVSVDYTSPIVSIDETISAMPGGYDEPIVVDDGRSAALQASALSSAARADPYDVLDAFTDLSEIHGQTTLGTEGPAGQYDIKTKYGKSWDFNPNNPDNLIGWDTHTLGSFIAVDSSGNPILDSSGNPVFTSFGKSVYDEMQGEGMIGPGQEVPKGMESALEDYTKGFSFEDIHEKEKDFWRGSFDDWWYNEPGTPWGQQWYDYPISDETTMADLPHWRSDVLPTEMAAMSEAVPQYQRELANRTASPLYMAGMENVSGIPYQGRPEFGTIEMAV